MTFSHVQVCCLCQETSIYFSVVNQHLVSLNLQAPLGNLGGEREEVFPPLQTLDFHNWDGGHGDCRVKVLLAQYGYALGKTWKVGHTLTRGEVDT